MWCGMVSWNWVWRRSEMRVEKIEVPASVRNAMEKPLAYLFARADRGGAGWIGRLDAPKGEPSGGIMFYAGHVLALSETEDELRPICGWTCELPDGWEEILAYMPPATAYCARDVAYRIPSTEASGLDGGAASVSASTAACVRDWWCRHTPPIAPV